MGGVAWGGTDSESITYKRSVGQVSRSSNRFTVSEEESRSTREVKLGEEDKRFVTQLSKNVRFIHDTSHSQSHSSSFGIQS